MKTKIPPISSKEIGNKTAVLYSVSQDCFHLETVFDYITSNIKTSVIKSKGGDYRLICICDSDIAGDAFIEKFKSIQKKFDDYNLDALINKALKGD